MELRSEEESGVEKERQRSLRTRVKQHGTTRRQEQKLTTKMRRRKSYQAVRGGQGGWWMLVVRRQQVTAARGHGRREKLGYSLAQMMMDEALTAPWYSLGAYGNGVVLAGLIREGKAEEEGGRK